MIRSSPSTLSQPHSSAVAATATADTILAPSKPNERIILYLVGGGFISGHPLRSHLAWTVAKWSGERVFAVNYRKSLSADSAFPACLIDALAGYVYLVEQLGFKAENITLMGDSAGGNLCLALARYLAELAAMAARDDDKGQELGQPGGMVLFSPWVDMTSSGASVKSNRNYDYPSALGDAATRSHTRHFPNSLSSPYFSPSLPSPDGSPRFAHLKNTKVYVQTGTAELLYSENVDLVDGMKAEGVDARLREIQGDIHVGVIFKRRAAMEAAEKDLEGMWGRREAS